jgi:hypothetical protein
MVTLVLCAVLSAEVPEDAPLVSDRPVETMTLRELKAEYALLDEKRPNIGGPISMIATGGGLVVNGSLSLLLAAAGFGGVGALFSGGSIAGYIFATMLVTGAGLLVGGIWTLKNRLPDRAVMSARMDEVQTRIDELDRGERRRQDAEEERRRYEQRAPTPQQQREAETFQL